VHAGPHPRSTVPKFVEGVGKAISWARESPRATAIARYEAISAKRQRNEDAEAVKHWKNTGIAGKGGRLSDWSCSSGSTGSPGTAS